MEVLFLMVVYSVILLANLNLLWTHIQSTAGRWTGTVCAFIPGWQIPLLFFLLGVRYARKSQ